MNLMKSAIMTYDQRPEAIDIISRYFAGNENVFSNVITYENLSWEAKMINLAESVIPEKKLMSLHYDMILNEGRNAIIQYHKNFFSKKNELLARAKLSLSSEESRKINEAVTHLSKLVKKRFAQPLNENTGAVPNLDPLSLDKLGAEIMRSASRAQTATPAQASIPSISAASTSTDLTQGFDTAIAGGEYQGETDGNILSFLKDLWNALSEGSSPWGVTHLILDIAGILGDIVFAASGVPIGTIADILNAMLYFYREKYLLGTISLIAGLVVGAGDLLKGFKWVAVPMEKVMLATVKGGSKEGAIALGKVAAKEKGAVIQGLRFIAKHIGGVAAKAGKMLGAFSEVFIAKLVGWLPIIGKPLREFFERMGRTLSKYSEDAASFASNFGKVEKEALEAVLKEADATIAESLAKGGSMKIENGIVTCFDAAGKKIGKEFSAEALTNPALIKRKYPNLFKASKDQAGEIAKYYTSVAKSGKKIQSGVGETLVKFGWATTKNSVRLAAFIGKQVIKIITGKDWQGAGYTEEEIQYWGNSALQSWIQDELIKKKEETGATYVPALDLESSDQETFERITNYQNEYANQFGQPNIIPVIYDKYGNEEIEEEFEDFWDAVKKGEVKREEAPAKTSSKAKNESFKYIVPFSKFNFV